MCSFQLVLPCYRHNICCRIECLENLLPWDLYSPFSAYTKNLLLFSEKFWYWLAKFFTMACKFSSKISAGVTRSLCLMKESYYCGNPEHIFRDLQTACMYEVNRQSNRSGQDILIVLPGSSCHDIAHSGSHILLSFGFPHKKRRNHHIVHLNTRLWWIKRLIECSECLKSWQLTL